MLLDVGGRGVDVDEDGFLVNVNDWNKEIAVTLAKTEQIDMTDSHWEVIHFLRDYYEEYKIAPMVRILTKAVGKKLGKEKGSTKYLYSLYPGGPAKQACKIAGLPRPTGCV